MNRERERETRKEKQQESRSSLEEEWNKCGETGGESKRTGGVAGGREGKGGCRGSSHVCCVH